MKTLLVYFIRLGLFVIRHSSIPLMTITMLQLFSNSVKTITLTNIRMCQTVCITILFETKKHIREYDCLKGAVNRPHLSSQKRCNCKLCPHENTKATRTYSSRLCTALSLPYQGGICPGRNLGPETETPRRNMGPGSHAGNDIVQRPPPLCTE